MASRQELRKHTRSVPAMGTVSRYAQQRVDERVMEIMSRRDNAGRRDSSSDQAVRARRFERGPVASRN